MIARGSTARRCGCSAGTRRSPSFSAASSSATRAVNPTGLVMSTTSLASLVAVWLRVPRLSAEEQMVSTRHFMREHNRLGLTSVIDAGGGGQNFPENYAAIAKLAADNQLTVRIGYAALRSEPGQGARELPAVGEDGSHRRRQRLLPHDWGGRIRAVRGRRSRQLRKGLGRGARRRDGEELQPR